MRILETEKLTKKFFDLTALKDVDLHVSKREIVGLIGPNGSGKTTLFNCVTGVMEPTSGRVFFEGEEITGLKPHQIALKGLTRTYQLITIFPNLTVLENMLIAVQQFQGERLLKWFLKTKDVLQMEKEAEEKARKLLEFMSIDHLTYEYGRNLSFGQQKLLEIAMSLMADPKLILLDEPAAAVNPTMIERIKQQIRALNQRGETFFIIEHNMDVVMDLCHRVIVLDAGEKIAEGTPIEVKNNPQVIEAYFGG